MIVNTTLSNYLNCVTPFSLIDKVSSKIRPSNHVMQNLTFLEILHRNLYSSLTNKSATSTSNDSTKYSTQSALTNTQFLPLKLFSHIGRLSNLSS
jgi:hypothetical protein